MLPQQVEALTPGCCSCKHARQSPTPRRGWDIVAGACSLGIWAIMPKCPLCLAAHVTLWTGLGLSFTQATYLRWSLMIISVASLLYLIARRRLRTIESISP